MTHYPETSGKLPKRKIGGALPSYAADKNEHEHFTITDYRVKPLRP
jgi:hypothetical protein